MLKLSDIDIIEGHEHPRVTGHWIIARHIHRKEAVLSDFELSCSRFPQLMIDMKKEALVRAIWNYYYVDLIPPLVSAFDFALKNCNHRPAELEEKCAGVLKLITFPK